MSIEDSLVTILKAHAPTFQLVGDRIRPLAVAADDDLPYVRFEIQESTIDTFTGSARHKPATIKIDCFSSTYTEASELRRRVKRALHNFATVVGDVRFCPIRHDDGSDQDLTEAPSPGVEMPTYRLASDFRALYVDV